MSRGKDNVLLAELSIIHKDESLISSCTTPAQHVGWSRHTVFGSRNEHDGGCDVGMRLDEVDAIFSLGEV
jgi:hypothetical protein